MKKKNKKKDELEEFKDVSVADMNVEGMRWYKNKDELEAMNAMKEVSPTKAERRAMIKGAYQAMMPMFLIGLGVFTLAFGLVMLYLYLHTH